MLTLVDSRIMRQTAQSTICMRMRMIMIMMILMILMGEHDDDDDYLEDLRIAQYLVDEVIKWASNIPMIF